PRHVPAGLRGGRPRAHNRRRDARYADQPHRRGGKSQPMIGRVTQLGLQRSSLAHLQQNLGAMAKLQERLTSGKVLTRPSDDPAATVDAMQVRADQRATAQYARNAADGDAWLTTVDSALGDVLSDLRRARDLTVRGASSGALGPSARAAIAAELRATADS